MVAQVLFYIPLLICVVLLADIQNKEHYLQQARAINNEAREGNLSLEDFELLWYQIDNPKEYL